MMRHAGEPAVARAAGEALFARAQAHGYDALILTVDAAVGGIRLRDVRNGLTIPPRLSLRTVAQMTIFPRWWMNVLTTDPLEFASLSSTGGTVGDLLTRVFDPGITAQDVSRLRSVWPGPLMLKGIQCLDDARLAADLGVDAIVLSNHGGRQVDKGNVPLELLPDVVDAVGDRVEVYIDGGIMSGTDIVAALAFGARGALIGRAYLYGLMAGGDDVSPASCPSWRRRYAPRCNSSVRPRWPTSTVRRYVSATVDAQTQLAPRHCVRLPGVKEKRVPGSTGVVGPPTRCACPSCPKVFTNVYSACGCRLAAWGRPHASTPRGQRDRGDGGDL